MYFMVGATLTSCPDGTASATAVGTALGGRYHRKQETRRQSGVIVVELPPNVAPYRRTGTFNADTVPAGLLSDHSTKAGVWARIVVERGQVTLRSENFEATLTPQRPGIVPPTRLHAVTVGVGGEFHVEFLREPAT